MDDKVKKQIDECRQLVNQYEQQSERSNDALFDALGKVYEFGESIYNDEGSLIQLSDKDKLTKPQKGNPYILISKAVFGDAHKTSVSKYAKALNLMHNKGVRATKSTASKWIKNHKYEDPNTGKEYTGLDACVRTANDIFRTPDDPQKKQNEIEEAKKRLAMRDPIGTGEAESLRGLGYANVLVRVDDDGNVFLLNVLEDDDNKVGDEIRKLFRNIGKEGNPLYPLYRAMKFTNDALPTKVKGKDRLFMVQNREPQRRHYASVMCGFTGYGPMAEMLCDPIPELTVRQPYGLTKDQGQRFIKAFDRDVEMKFVNTKASGNFVDVRPNGEEHNIVFTHFDVMQKNIMAPLRGLNYQFSYTIDSKAINQVIETITDFKRQSKELYKQHTEEGGDKPQSAFSTWTCAFGFGKAQKNGERPFSFAKTNCETPNGKIEQKAVSLGNVSGDTELPFGEKSYPVFDMDDVQRAFKAFRANGAQDLSLNFAVSTNTPGATMLMMESQTTPERARVMLPDMLSNGHYHDGTMQPMEWFE
jgi:hypothetical protein